VDLDYYGFPTFPIFNTLIYNALGSGPGSQLYGVEPFSFYVKNLLVNFNIVAVLAVVSVFVVAFSALIVLGTKSLGMRTPYSIAVLHLSPMYVWILFMAKLEHKVSLIFIIIFVAVMLN
jgi:alpha-1,2-mannosyltransferase